MFADLIPLTRSAKIQCFMQDVPSGADYKFLVLVMQPTLGYSEAIDVVVEVLSPPQLGSLKVV